MTYLAIGVAALIAMRLVRHVTAGRAAIAAPALLLMLYAWSRTTLAALGVWIACIIVMGILWRSDRG